ncbi:MAG: eukaryotic-like serine/threonine-protein kinase [Blastocatellia bacterium]|jgi:serine/threonine-protein kinase|nr:eukaryotic-like serine/threonine-protein kinase [Blastocatellia bacterium]
MHQIGDTINSRWKLVDELCPDSGQANTFLAVDSLDADDSAKYVIKLLKVQDPKALARFDKEIKASFALKHRNIVKVKDSAYENTATPYLVTEYCSGGALSAEKISTLPTVDRLRVFEQICEAIAYAHRDRVLHRDIKPGNVFLETSDSLTPIVGDFGLCFFMDDKNTERPTATKESMGNWEFGPPERTRREDHPSASFDVYQLGKLLYWLLSDGVILDREDFDTPYFDLRKTSCDHAVHLAYDIISKSVIKDPERRYQTGTQMLEDVKELVMFAENEGRYLDCDIPQSCVFCRLGNYDWEFLGKHNNDRYQFADYGLSVRQIPEAPFDPWILFGKCGRCGNVQQFRLDDRVKRSSEWKNVPASPHTR